jgi:hypothetical protein
LQPKCTAQGRVLNCPDHSIELLLPLVLLLPLMLLAFLLLMLLPAQ